MMTTEEQIIEDEAAETRAWEAASTVPDCSSGLCIHDKMPEVIFRLGFRLGMDHIRKATSK